MNEALYMMRFICAVEGISGFLLNLALFLLLIRSKIRSNRIFLVPIFVSSTQALFLCVAIAIMNFTHIFYDGTFAIPLVGPVVQYIPKCWRDLIYKAAFVGMSFMWTVTPATSILQFTALKRSDWNQRKRLAIAFAPTVFCQLLIAYTVPMTMPSNELAEIMGKSMKDLYGMEENEFIECYGVSGKYADINNNMSLLQFAITYAAIPYTTSYTIILTLMIQIRQILSSKGITLSKHTLRLQRQFYVMQFLQSFLPLIILSIPLAVVMYGAVTGAQLGFWTLPLTIFVWLCPVIQASVQLRYVKQSNTTSPESSRIQFSKMELPKPALKTEPPR